MHNIIINFICMTQENTSFCKVETKHLQMCEVAFWQNENPKKHKNNFL